jgi:hypothetical protein
MEPGANPPVDEFRFLQFIPQSMAFWKRRAIDAGNTMDSVWGAARQRVEARRATGERRDCIIDDLLDKYEKSGWPMSQHAFNNLMGGKQEFRYSTSSDIDLNVVTITHYRVLFGFRT